MQRALDAVHEHCRNLILTVNSEKTKIISFSRGKVTYHPAFIFKNSNIEAVADYGVKFHYILVFNQLFANSYCERKILHCLVKSVS